MKVIRNKESERTDIELINLPFGACCQLTPQEKTDVYIMVRTRDPVGLGTKLSLVRLRDGQEFQCDARTVVFPVEAEVAVYPTTL